MLKTIIMTKYFSEFEFKTSFGNKYWLPLFFNAGTFEEASAKRQSVIIAINEHYEVTRSTLPKPFIEGFNSEYLKEYIHQRLTGRLAILEFNVWRFSDFIPSSDLSFTQQFELIDLPTMPSQTTVATTIQRRQFPVRQYSLPQNLGNNEALIINVVDTKSGK